MFGGVARNTINLANEMAENDHDVTIVILGFNRDLISEIDERVQVHFLKTTLMKSFIPFVFFYWSYTLFFMIFTQI